MASTPSDALPTGTVTLLFTDIEGSTRLWESHPAAMRPALARHDALLRACIDAHGGRIFKTGGDAFFAAFAVATDAVAAALDAQRALAREPWPGSVPLRARMALHTGAVELREGDYFGGAVSRVARMVAAAHGGQTLLSESTHNLCRDQLPPLARVAPLGAFAFKDIERAEGVFQLGHPDLAATFPPLRAAAAAVAGGATAEQGPARAAGGEREAPSIAVLPFVNMSQDPDNAYFADGLSEELLNVLAKIRGLRVASRTSAFSFKGSSVDIPTIARKLNVRSVLEGSVRKAGKRVRVTAQLIEVDSDSHLWSETYDRDLDDIFAVQDDIAQSVVKELRGMLLGNTAAAASPAGAAPQPDAASNAAASAAADVQRASVGRTRDTEAYELYLRARALTGKLTQAATDEAIALLERAIALDPRFALAWAALSQVHREQAGYGFTGIREGADRARAAARKAIELEPDLAAGHLELARTLLGYDWDFAGARRALDRALALTPTDPGTLMTASSLAGVEGNPEARIAFAQRALALDPLSADAHWRSGFTHFGAGRYQEALVALREVARLDPSRSIVQPVISVVHTLRGELDEARAALEGEHHPVFQRLALSMLEWRRGDRAASDAAKQSLIDGYAWTAAFQVAALCAFRGEVDEAFDWLDTAHRQRDPGMTLLQNDPVLQVLKDDPRWNAVLDRMGIIRAA